MNFWVALACWTTIWSAVTLLDRRRMWRRLQPRDLHYGRVQLQVRGRTGYWRTLHRMRADVYTVVDDRIVREQFRVTDEQLDAIIGTTTILAQWIRR